MVYLHDQIGYSTNKMYHVESPVDEPPWVTGAAGSLANLEVILLQKMIKKCYCILDLSIIFSCDLCDKNIPTVVMTTSDAGFTLLPTIDHTQCECSVLYQ